MMIVLGLTIAVSLVAYNLVTNLERSREAIYLLRNIAAGIALVIVARAAGLEWADLGLSPDELSDGWNWGRLVVLVVAVGAAAVGGLVHRVPVLERALHDQRADMPPDQLAFHALVRIPIGTAAFEEFAFRGVLLAAFVEALGQAGAVTASSIAFGLWHIGPARLTARINGREEPRQIRREVATAVIVTTLGGVGFALLRLGSGSLLAPVLAHAAINIFGLLMAAVTHRTS